METQAYYLLIVAAIVGVGFFFVPQLLQLRILVLRKLNLNWFADLHANHFEGWVTGIRIAFVLVIALLVYAALT